MMIVTIGAESRDDPVPPDYYGAGHRKFSNRPTLSCVFWTS
jgi:hypothetical protein